MSRFCSADQDPSYVDAQRASGPPLLAAIYTGISWHFVGDHPNHLFPPRHKLTVVLPALRAVQRGSRVLLRLPRIQREMQGAAQALGLDARIASGVAVSGSNCA